LPELKEFGPDPCEGQEFTVAVWLKNVTTDSVPKGVYGVEIKLQWNKTYLEFKGRTLKIGVSGGVLNSPYFTAKDELTTTTVANDTYWIASSSLAGADPWFGDGIVAEFTFKIIKQPKQLLGEEDVTVPLTLVFTDLVDGEAKMVSHNRKNGNITLYELPIVVTGEYTVTVDSRPFKIIVECNATANEVAFNKTERILTFKITTYTGCSAFCNVSIPKTFMWVDSLSDWEVKLNATTTIFEVAENQTHTMLYFTFPEGITRVAISSKYIWPAIITLQEVIQVDGEDFTVLFKTNATNLTNVAFNRTKAEITFSTKTHSQRTAFFNVTISKVLLWVDSLEEWDVKIDSAIGALNLNRLENETHTMLYFECPEGTHQINIKGKYVWSPQGLPSWMMPTIAAVIVILAIIVAVVLIKRARKKA